MGDTSLIKIPVAAKLVQNGSARRNHAVDKMHWQEIRLVICMARISWTKPASQDRKIKVREREREID